MEEELSFGKLGEIMNYNDVVVDDHGVEDSVQLKETRDVAPDSGSRSSSSSSSSDSDEETRDLSVNENSDDIVVNQEKLEEKEAEGVVQVEPLVEDTIRETDTLFNGLETNEMKEQSPPPLDQNTRPSPDVIENGLEDVAGLIDSVPGEKLVESSDSVELVLDENVNAGLQIDEHSKDSSVVADLNSGENADTSVGKPVDLPSVVADKSDDECGVEVDIPDNRIHQPVISLAPRARHMTSWRSCCGLLDVLRRSDR